MISFGEGIIAGFFYAIFAIVFLAKLAQEDSSHTVLYVMNGLIIAMSILLAVGNACQMGLVDQVLFVLSKGNLVMHFWSPVYSSGRRLP